MSFCDVRVFIFVLNQSIVTILVLTGHNLHHVRPVLTSPHQAMAFLFNNNSDAMSRQNIGAIPSCPPVSLFIWWAGGRCSSPAHRMLPVSSVDSVDFSPAWDPISPTQCSMTVYCTDGTQGISKLHDSPSLTDATVLFFSEEWSSIGASTWSAIQRSFV